MEIEKSSPAVDKEKKNSGVNTIKCMHCERTYTSQKCFLHHLTKHVESYPHKCLPCNRSFQAQSSLQRHNLKHTIDDFVCNFNPQQFKTQNDYLNFQKTHNKLYECNVCYTIIESATDLISHMQTHIHSMKDLPKHIFKLKNFPKDSIKCDVCDIRFMNTYSLRPHLYIHMKFKPHKCQFCSKNFIKESSLRRHMKSVHSELTSSSNELKNFSCPVCQKTFRWKSNIKQHTLTAHANEKKKVSKKDEDLEKQEIMKTSCLIHSEDKNKEDVNLLNNVNEDEKENKKKNDDALLRRKKSTTSTNKIWKCRICSKSFALVTKLKNHEAAHGIMPLFDCVLCDKIFSHLEELNEHAIIHKEDTPWRCIICDKMFASENNLTKHHMMHFVAKISFTCTDCQKVYTSEHFLKIHRLKHHSVNEISTLNEE